MSKSSVEPNLHITGIEQGWAICIRLSGNNASDMRASAEFDIGAG